MHLQLSIIALFLLTVFGLSGTDESMVHKVMHERAIAPWDDAKLPGAISHAEHPEADATRQAEDILNVPASVSVVPTRQMETRANLYARESLVGVPGVVVRDNGESGFATARSPGVLSNHSNDNFIASVNGVPFDAGYYHYFGIIEVARTVSPGRPLEAVFALCYQF